MEKNETTMKILIFDDEIVITTQLDRQLRNLGYDVIGSAADGAEAVKIAREKMPDLALLDIVMPGTDGIAAARTIWSELRIPVIFITAHADDIYLQRVKTVEPLAYIIKPFQEDDLKIALKLAAYKIEAEKKLHASQEKSRIMMANTSDMISQHAKDGTFLAVSPSSLPLTGYKEEMLLNQSLFDLVYERDLNDVRKFFNEITKQHSPRTVEYRFFTKRGDYQWVESTGNVILDVKANPSGEYLLTTRDISVRKQSEQMKLNEQVSLTEQNLTLQQKQIVADDIIEQLKLEKLKITEKMQININTIILPIIKKLKIVTTSMARLHVDMLEESLLQLTAPYLSNNSKLMLNLTPKEIEVCDLLAAGNDSLNISSVLNMSVRTVHTHRNNIRKKLGIQNQEINLETHLKTMLVRKAVESSVAS